MHYKKYALYEAFSGNIYLMQYDKNIEYYTLVKPLIVLDEPALTRTTFTVLPQHCGLTSDNSKELEEEAFIHAL